MINNTNKKDTMTREEAKAEWDTQFENIDHKDLSKNMKQYKKIGDKLFKHFESINIDTIIDQKKDIFIKNIIKKERK